MDVWVEVTDDRVDRGPLQADLERRMKEVLSVKVKVTPVGKGELDTFTQTSKSSKVKRLMDRRHTASR